MREYGDDLVRLASSNICIVVVDLDLEKRSDVRIVGTVKIQFQTRKIMAQSFVFKLFALKQLFNVEQVATN